METFKIKMDKNSNLVKKIEDDSFIQFCLQTLTPLINFPLISEDKEIIKSNSASCNCSKSGCLKLYCECFAKGRYCIGCNCINCFNVPNYEQIRNKAMAQIVHRNAEAFLEDKPTISGCVCKKSNCLKKYCKCHLNGRRCSDKCKCVDCKNIKRIS